MKIFIDTNIPLHHTPLDQIDWREVIGIESITLIIPLVVFDELDQHTHSSRLGARAKRSRKKLYEFIETGIVKDQIKAETIIKPNTKILEEYDLDPQQNDQWILGTILNYIKNHPDENIALLTADVGMRIRAKALGISAIMLDDKYKLEDETEEQKEIKRLRAENEKLKSAVPQLSMTFRAGNPITLELNRPDYENYIHEEIRIMKYKDFPTVSDSDNFSFRLNKAYTRSEAISYNSQLGEYYEAYETYLKERRGLYFAEMLTTKLEVLLKNTGPVLGKNIDIELRFPAGLTVSEKSIYKRFPEPNKKNPPILGHLKPLTWSNDTDRGYYQKSDPETPIKVSQMTDGTTRVDFHVSILKQQMDIPLPVIYISFDSESNVHGFNIEYFLRSENVPDVVRGVLNVKATFKE